MKAFFENLDAKAAAFIKARLGRKVTPVSPALPPEEAGDPLVLILGSLTDCTLKDAVAYARGLAESYITAPELARIRVFEDVAAGRYVYEIHEGGPGFSIADMVLTECAAGNKVRVHLANGAHAHIEEVHGELISLIYPAGSADTDPTTPGLAEHDEGHIWDIEALCSGEPLKEIYPENKQLTRVSGAMLGVSLSLFMLTGGAYTVLHSGLLDGDPMFRMAKSGIMAEASDNPVWQLDKARNAAAEDQSVRMLKKDSKGWSWELGQ